MNLLLSIWSSATPDYANLKNLRGAPSWTYIWQDDQRRIYLRLPQKQELPLIPCSRAASSVLLLRSRLQNPRYGWFTAGSGFPSECVGGWGCPSPRSLLLLLWRLLRVYCNGAEPAYYIMYCILSLPSRYHGYLFSRMVLERVRLMRHKQKASTNPGHKKRTMGALLLDHKH
jgi:hypothetical protein